MEIPVQCEIVFASRKREVCMNTSTPRRSSENATPAVIAERKRVKKVIVRGCGCGCGLSFLFRSEFVAAHRRQQLHQWTTTMSSTSSSTAVSDISCYSRSSSRIAQKRCRRRTCARRCKSPTTTSSSTPFANHHRHHQRQLTSVSSAHSCRSYTSEGYALLF